MDLIQSVLILYIFANKSRHAATPATAGHRCVFTLAASQLPTCNRQHVPGEDENARAHCRSDADAQQINQTQPQSISKQ